MMHVCNPALRLCSALTPGRLAVGDVAANRKTHARGIPPPPPPGPASSSGETEDHSNAARGNKAVEECAKVVQVRELNMPSENGRRSDQTGNKRMKGSVSQLSVFSRF